MQKVATIVGIGYAITTTTMFVCGYADPAWLESAGATFAVLAISNLAVSKLKNI